MKRNGAATEPTATISLAAEGVTTAKATRRSSFHGRDAKKSDVGIQDSGPAVGFYVGSEPVISDQADADVEARITGRKQKQALPAGYLHQPHRYLPKKHCDNCLILNAEHYSMMASKCDYCLAAVLPFWAVCYSTSLQH